eukprot:347009-Rhodomonas_salina.2
MSEAEITSLPGPKAHRQIGLKSLSISLAALLSGVDLVVSDVIAGLMLLRLRQQQQIQRTEGAEGGLPGRSEEEEGGGGCLLYTSPSPRDRG